MSDHYNQGEIECIEALKSALTPEEYRGFIKGNIIKYLWRERFKGNSPQDINKANCYMEYLLDEIS